MDFFSLILRLHLTRMGNYSSVYLVHQHHQFHPPQIKKLIGILNWFSKMKEGIEITTMVGKETSYKILSFNQKVVFYCEIQSFLEKSVFNISLCSRKLKYSIFQI